MRYVSFLPQEGPRARSLFDFIQFHEKLCGSWDECMPSEKRSMMTITSVEDISGLFRTMRFNDILRHFGMEKRGMESPTTIIWRTPCGMDFASYFSRFEAGEKMIARTLSKHKPKDSQDNPAIILGDIEWE